jgi:hypothetical protein
MNHLPAYGDGKTEHSETLAYKIQTPGNYPKENIQHTGHGESLKSRIVASKMMEDLEDFNLPGEDAKKILRKVLREELMSV